MHDWDARQYTKFEEERTRPAIDLINRITIFPSRILDIGCGPGNSTHQLAEHFPKAELLGIDSSDTMLQQAKMNYPHLTFCQARIPDALSSVGLYDLIFSNACLHWIPDHPKLLPALINGLRDGGQLAVQMPLVQTVPFYLLLNQMIAESPWKKLRTIQNFHNLSPEETYDILAMHSRKITLWETTYYHRVSSHARILDWYAGSGLRPYLNALTPAERPVFGQELLARVRETYPLQADGSILLKIPRLFFIVTP